MATTDPTPDASTELAAATQPPALTLQSSILTDEEIHRLWRLAGALAKSGMFRDVVQAEQAFGRILLGRDLGLSPTQSLMSLDVVEGNARIRSVLLAAWVRQHPEYDYKVVEHDAEHCVITFFYKGEEEGTSAFSIGDAKAAGLVKDHPKSAWRAHPRNMLWARAMSNGVRWYCPDLTGGIAVYTEADSFDSTAVEITAGEGDGSEPGWQGLSDELVADVEATLAMAETFGHPLDRATVQMYLNGQPAEVVEAWLGDTRDMLAMRAPEGQQTLDEPEGGE